MTVLNPNKSFIKRKKTAFCILAGLCAISLFILIIGEEKEIKNKGGFYAVKIKHYGIDAKEMERSVTIPLEDALFAISGVSTVQSTSENGLSSVFINFKPGVSDRYEAVRDVAQRVYETLPSSAQRPEILSSGNSRIPVWSAAVYADDYKSNLSSDYAEMARLLEKTVKPRLESLKGAGEVIISGVALNEIYIILDDEKIASLYLDPVTIAHTLAMNDSVFSGGTIIKNNIEVIVMVDGRIESLEKALVPLADGKYVELSQIAAVIEKEREPDILSRLNGRKTAGIAIMGQHDADLRKLSNNIKKEIAALDLPLEITVLSDLGAEEAVAFRSVLNAALTGAIMVVFIGFVMNKEKSLSASGFFRALTVPVVCLLSIAVMALCGYGANKLMLAGIAAGVGTAVDSVILCSEKLRKCVCYEESSAALKKLAGPMIAGAATTAAALLPLAGIENSGAGIIAVSIAVTCITALVISLTLLPPLLLWDMEKLKKKKEERKIKDFAFSFKRYLYRFLAADLRFTVRHPVFVLTIGIIITFSAIFALFAKGTDTGSGGSEDSVYAQIEFEGGLLAEEVDRRLAVYGEQLSGFKGIKNVETGARTGSASLLIGFDPKLIKAGTVRELAKNTPIHGGFVFFHESSAKERYWEIKVYGKEDKKCREIARELAAICASSPLVKDRVLNFKDGSKKMTLLPDRELFAEAGAGFSAVASKIRTGVYGPVIYKRTDENGETDVRIVTNKENVTRQSREGTLGILVYGNGENGNRALQVGSIMKERDETEPSGLRRDNRRTTASITITTKPMDPRRVKKTLMPLFEKLELPQGYSIEFDPEAIKESRAVTKTILSFLMAIIFCYMIIASINESFTVPLIVLIAIPVSLSVPALCLVLSGSTYNLAAACAFIAASGITVNAAVFCIDALRNSARSVYSALREKMPALLSITGTTVAGTIPFLFLKEGANTLIRTMSLVVTLGAVSSCLCSITLIPSLFILQFRLCGIKSLNSGENYDKKIIK